MKKLIMFLCLLMPSLSMVFAQNDKNLTKIEIGDLSKICKTFPYVKLGEFVVDFEHMVFDQNLYRNNYKYFVILRDERDDPSFIKTNNFLMNFSKSDLPIELLRAGFAMDDYVYISKKKSVSVDNSKIIYNLHIGRQSYGPYDGIERVLPDGFVYKNKGVYTYVRYDNQLIAVNNYSILDQAEYEGDFVQCSINDKLLKFYPKEKVKYFKCYDGHYYILYNDKAMNNTLLIVDGVGYELDGVVNSLNLKFSHNGEHWIAAGRDYVMVDGVYVKRLSDVIKYVDINNNGDYMYVVDGKGFSEKVYLNEKVVVDVVEVESLTVDDNQVFNYIFKNENGFFYGLDNHARDFNENIKNYYYPAFNDDNHDFVVKSPDGKHRLEYNNTSPYIIIDGNKIESVTTPHYMVWNNKEHCFMWNVLENFKLIVYKYQVK